MHKKDTSHIINEAFHALEKAVARFEQHPRKKHLHAIRVNIKKLQAVLQLAAEGLPKKIKKLHAAAGALRNLQLHRQLIKQRFREQALPAQYLGLLKIELEKAGHALNKILQRQRVKKAAGKILAAISPTNATGKAMVILQQKQREIQALLSKERLRDDDLHTIRKRIKDRLYITAAIARNENNYKKEKLLAKALGGFMDCVVSLSFLDYQWTNKLPEAEQLLLKGWKSEISSVKKQLRKEIMVLLA